MVGAGSAGFGSNWGGACIGGMASIAEVVNKRLGVAKLGEVRNDLSNRALTCKRISASSSAEFICALTVNMVVARAYVHAVVLLLDGTND